MRRMDREAMVIHSTGGNEQSRWPTAIQIIVALLGVGCALAIQWHRLVNHDVAYLTWVADKVMHGAVFGVDIQELNPPLAFIIYSPAALLAQWTGYPHAIKLCIAALALVSMAVVAKTAPKNLTLPLIAGLGLFLAIGFPREFGQREEIAMFLLAPYVAGYARQNRWNVVSGVMAGIGACIKPYFLLVPIILLAHRRKIAAAEWALAITGFAYAAIILIFFRPYLEVMLPAARTVYSGIGVQEAGQGQFLILLDYLLVAVGIAALARDRNALRLGLAGIGFGLAGALQGKFFDYHFMAAWGFVLLCLIAILVCQTGIIRILALAGLVTTLVHFAFVARPWLNDAEGRETTVRAMLRQIDRADSFIVISDYPFPAFPTAIYTRTPYLGAASCNMGLAAVGMLDTGQDSTIDASVRQIALGAELADLRKQPELVIVNTDWQSFSGLRSNNFDGLRWLNRNAGFHRLWQHYHFTGQIGQWKLYRRNTAIEGAG
ncbi:MAG: glycosyltransferase family 87 protein [Sphingomonadaceae bacterium]